MHVVVEVTEQMDGWFPSDCELGTYRILRLPIGSQGAYENSDVLFLKGHHHVLWWRGRKDNEDLDLGWCLLIAPTKGTMSCFPSPAPLYSPLV